ncbi:hypothetical protein [Eupransor demetentiae]|uniref:Uncharacterized protein n=1 Tax=Eupransor demetentiae TaxID=3109584 RepID=A0ABP0ERL9_9LACO|nr:hypothetical protein R54876_GBNLAHCA_00218 [Lactobacillaceae bacterium LMG 33000]
MKKVITGLVAAALIGVGGTAGYTYLNSSSVHDDQTSHKSSKSASSSSVAKSQVSTNSQDSNEIKQPTTGSNSQASDSYDPNKTWSGTEISMSMIDQTRTALSQAGLPADNYGNADIKRMIAEASQQNTSVVDYAKSNYHS